MSQNKPNKTLVYKEFLLSEIRKGNVDAVNVLRLFRSKWQIADSSFYRHWKSAWNSYREEETAKKNAVAEVEQEEAKKTALLDIMTKNERMQIATKIARGTAKKVGGVLIIPSPSDQMRAMDYLSKIENDYASVKTELSLNAPIIIDWGGKDSK